MNAKYKVRFFVECMVVVEVERDRKTPLGVVAREVYGETDFGEEVRKGNVEFSDSVVAYMVDEYDAKGELVEPGDCHDVDDKFISGEIER